MNQNIDVIECIFVFYCKCSFEIVISKSVDNKAHKNIFQLQNAEKVEA